jgi:uncharacterized OB-fold protein
MSLLERDKNAPQSWHGNMPVTSRYTYGLAGEKFFRAIKDHGKIMGSHCPKCERTFVPATLFCERCLSELDVWVDVGTVGKIHTYTLLYENYDGSARINPEIIAMISFGDGGLVHRLKEVIPDQVTFGMLVEAVFKEPDEREGSIQDILYFRPKGH